MNTRQIHMFYNQAIIWHDIVWVFLKIYTDLQEIYNFCSQNCFCYCFCTILLHNFASKFCKFLANLCKSSEILEQCHVKWWLKYWNNKSVSWRLSCISIQYAIFMKSFQFLNGVQLLSWAMEWNEVEARRRGPRREKKWSSIHCSTFIQVNNYEIVVNFFHISHNLTWYSAIIRRFTRIYPVW